MCDHLGCFCKLTIYPLHPPLPERILLHTLLGCGLWGTETGTAASYVGKREDAIQVVWTGVVPKGKKEGQKQREK